MAQTRTEHDALGPVEVPRDRYWGAQTQRSIENFPIGAARMPIDVVHALALVKHAAATVNQRLGKLDAARAEAIRAAAQEVMGGQLDDHFPLVVYQTGSGTQTNMNVNEVIANRAIVAMGGQPGDRTKVHPNDHVNMSQSSNDVFPTAMSIAALVALEDALLPALSSLARALAEKKSLWRDALKIGRTHLMDATPVTFGQVFSGFEAQVRRAATGLENALAGLRELAIGGTAVGTGINAPPGFGEAMAEEISTLTGKRFEPAPNRFAVIAAHDEMVAVSGALRVAASALMRIANDIRLLGSGPRCGIGELILPANEPGSSIMPGKVNPTQCEALTMVCARVLGNDVTVGISGACGQFELNAFKPVIIASVLESVRLLGDAVRSFETRCIAGLQVDRARARALLDRSLMLVTAIAPLVGYDEAARVAKLALERDCSLREVVVDLGLMSGDDYDAAVRPELMARPGEEP